MVPAGTHVSPAGWLVSRFLGRFLPDFIPGSCPPEPGFFFRTHMSIVFDYPSINCKLNRRDQKAEFEAKEDEQRKSYAALSLTNLGTQNPNSSFQCSPAHERVNSN